jgi:hypothetical protein
MYAGAYWKCVLHVVLGVALVYVLARSTLAAALGRGLAWSAFDVPVALRR